MTIDLNDELVQDFLVESEETVELISKNLVELEQSPDDKALLNQVFRSFHNIKGGGGFLGFEELVRVCHSAEEVFDRLRNGQCAIDGALTDAILEATDVIASMIAGIRQGIKPPAAEPELLHRLAGYVNLTHSKTPPQSKDPAEPEPPTTVLQHPVLAEEEQVRSVRTSAEIVTVQTAVVDGGAVADKEISDDEFEALLDRLPGLRSGTEELSPTVTDTVLTTSPDAMLSTQQDGTRSDQELSELLHAVVDHPQSCAAGQGSQWEEDSDIAPSSAAKSGLPDASKKDPNQVAAKSSVASVGANESTIRVGTNDLDAIMNMVGELVLARNRLSTLDVELGDEDLTQAVNNLSLVSSDLQALVMKTRMQPIKKAFGRFPRVVRDLARTLHKEVQLEMEGEDTALDKTLVDALADPLVHLVRNSVDHGIEKPDKRVAAGKPRCGRVRLMASQKGDHIQVGVADDGAGLDAEKLRQGAVDKGLISPEVAARMSQEECYDLIFMPGFTTKAVASNVSGRGVGMDVVKTRVGQFNGSVRVQSGLGTGTIIHIKVPLTLAIMPTLMVKVVNQIYAIPLLSILEILEYDEGISKWVDSQKVIVLQDQVVPVYSLRDWLITESVTSEPRQKHLVLVGLGAARHGLIVDELLGQEEVVIKPLGKLLHGTPGLVGATITGDGKIALILDIMGLIRHYTAQREGQVASCSS